MNTWLSHLKTVWILPIINTKWPSFLMSTYSENIKHSQMRPNRNFSLVSKKETSKFTLSSEKLAYIDHKSSLLRPILMLVFKKRPLVVMAIIKAAKQEIRWSRIKGDKVQIRGMFGCMVVLDMHRTFTQASYFLPVWNQKSVVIYFSLQIYLKVLFLGKVVVFFCFIPNSSNTDT